MKDLKCPICEENKFKRWVKCDNTFCPHISDWEFETKVQPKE